ncbi:MULTISPECIES: type 2 isopentenyl-diphosphate Delta-isomerase [Bacillaceae]|uniref:type 2 isopentenyl-diphosphate Delta-isomerase n=1 Tax=Bacillaceae TaxID=186817 RepID=UPI001E2C9A35|nr:MULTISPECIES: type 2 isopentenyl-diphosphate Delta-isomerase [Bacillaceae]MCE4047653.1 type 2 isopentenyl-diphosphate Delta-isomerase [Bacillus sp. Au-Bac7]MCM3031099.1 type 2 isopentenyl-diphosphate Delta-isomerase [Niallia sp. MER 6]
MDEKTIRQKRKEEHIELALQQNYLPHADFDDLFLIHRSLPETGIEDIKLQTKIGPLSLPYPIFINAMTGGSEKSGEINGALAEACMETGIAMAVGSQHAGIRNEALAHTYKIVRKKNPKGIVFANVGGDVPIDYALKAIDMLEADALQVHVNVPQELVMPEGERDFTNILLRLEKMAAKLDVPVIVKETGFGMCTDTLLQLSDAGIQYVDIGGRGGTNFVHIENERRSKRDFAYLKEWGQSAAVSLLEAQPVLGKLTIIASGGIRNPLDAVKCFSLGAAAAGIAGPFLKILHNEGVVGLIDELEEWKEHLKTLLVLQGAKSIASLHSCPIVATGRVKEWSEARGHDWQGLARRRPK